MRGVLVALGALVIGAGGGLLGYELVRARPEPPDPAIKQTAALDLAAAQLDREIGELRTRVQAQAKLIAGQQIVRGIVVTDQASAADALEAIDIELTRAGEIVQIGQRAGSFHMKLFMAPATVAGAYPSPRDGKPGSYHEVLADQLWVSESAEVHPNKMRDANGVETPYVNSKNRKPVIGYAMVSRPLVLAPVLTRLGATLESGQLEVAGERRPFGTPAGARAVTKSLVALPDARLVASVPAPAPAGGYSTGILVAGGAVAALGVGLVILGLMLRRPRPRPLVRQRSTPIPRTLIKSLIETDARTPIDFEHTMVDSLPAGFDDTLAAAQLPRPTGTPFQPTQSPSESGTIHPQQVKPGSSIGRWQIVRQLGGGGMAEVYLAQAHGEGGFEKQVAIKVMHPHLARDERTIAHFLDEARLAAGITHQNVVAIHDLGRIGDDYFIVMEYIDGLDLEHLLASARAAGRPIPLNVGLGLLRRICDGLTAAHEATSPDGQPLNIVHRDVKSA
ncbi:MAG TPA: serine/threonine-protein kinase, partial [Kofleriaceae bacterium]